jgi:hypothetical protein
MSVDVWALYEELRAANPKSLTLVQRNLVAICDLLHEVDDGGFDSYFRDEAGNSAQTALVALPDVLGRDWADLLRTATRLLGSPYPSDPDERAELIDRRDLTDRLNDLDDRFYALEAATDTAARLADYVAAGPAKP